MPNQQSDEPAAPGLISIQPTLHPQHQSFPLPLTPHTTLHLQTTRLSTSTLIFLTTTDPSTPPSTAPLGSFIYAIPNVSPAIPPSICRPPVSPACLLPASEKLTIFNTGLPAHPPRGRPDHAAVRRAGEY